MHKDRIGQNNTIIFKDGKYVTKCWDTNLNGKDIHYTFVTTHPSQIRKERISLLWTKPQYNATNNTIISSQELKHNNLNIE